MKTFVKMVMTVPRFFMNQLNNHYVTNGMNTENIYVQPLLQGESTTQEVNGNDTSISWGNIFLCEVEKISEDSLDSTLSPSVKIQIMGMIEVVSP